MWRTEFEHAGEAFRESADTALDPPREADFRGNPQSYGGLDPSQGDSETGRVPPSRALSVRLAAAIVAIVGAVVLVGWAFDVEPLEEVVVGLAAMKANTALAFVLIGTGLWLSTLPSSRKWPRVVSRVAAIGVILIGGATVFEYELATSFGIDDILFGGADGQSRFPGRPSAATAGCILLIGMALLLHPARRRFGQIVFQFCTLSAMLIAWLALVGYLYGVDSLYKIASYSSMALHTVLSVLIACFGLLQVQGDFGIMAQLRSPYAGGTIGRKLLPAIVICPLVLGWLRLKGEHLGLYGLEFGVAILVVANIVVLSIIVWSSTRSLNQLDSQRERALKQMEQHRVGKRFRELLESAPDPMVIVDPQGQMVLVNSQTERLFGYGREELLGRPVEMLIPERFRPEHPAHRDTYFANPRVRGMATGADLFGRRKNGSEFPCEVSLSPLETEEGVLVCSAIRDITARKRAEDEARRRLQQEKLAEHRAELARVMRVNTMGEMASGIAHELNQPLSAIANYAKGCTRRLQADGAQTDQLIEALNSIAGEAMRASEIIRSLKRYVKKCKPQRELVDINSIVKHAAQLVVGEAHMHDVALDLCCSDSLPQLSADPIQLEQVVVNLLANGIDALEDASASKQLTVHTRQSDSGGIEVAVADNGCGFAAELKHKIFEPFFTTKPHGLGMGLAISRSMIEAHGGRLHARRNEHGGATFVFTLPLEAEPCYA